MKGNLQYEKGKWVIKYKYSIEGDDVIIKTYPLLESDVEELGEPTESFSCNVKFEEILINPMGREVDPNNLAQNHSGCMWYAKLIKSEKYKQKQHLIDIMKGDEELGLYDESREIKVEDVFNDEKRESVKRVIHQHKVLTGLSLINPLHLQMTDNGHGEFPDGYKLTEKGIQYIIEQLNK